MNFNVEATEKLRPEQTKTFVQICNNFIHQNQLEIIIGAIVHMDSTEQDFLYLAIW